MDRVDPATAYSGQRVCVTGGAGFIGSHLCDAMVERGADVVVLDDLSQGRAENLAAVRDRIRLEEGSILDDRALARALDGAQCVFHLAAIASVPRSVREPARYFAVNGMGTARVIEAARSAGVARLVYAASSSAYGDQPGQPRVETMPADPRSPYAAAKCAGEYLVRSAARCHELSCVSLRFFNVFGPRQRFDSAYAAVVPLFTRAVLDGRSPTVYGDGGQTRDFTYVDNNVHACLLAGVSRADLCGQTLNVAAGHSASVRELLDAIAARLGTPTEPQFAPERVGEVRDSLASIEAARALIDYEPIVDFDTGLDRAVAYYRLV